MEIAVYNCFIPVVLISNSDRSDESGVNDDPPGPMGVQA